MQQVNRIFVTGDILRQRQFQPGVSSQNPNILWMYHLIKPALQLISCLKVVPVLHTGKEFCLGRQLYSINGLPLSFQSWINIYNRDPSTRELAAIQATFDEALVIGFEMPEIIVRGLDYLEIPYIDFTIHPARFMDDLIFGVRSNIPMLKGYLEHWVVTHEEIHIAAGLAMSTLVRMPRLPTCEESEDIALFAGQTTDDKVLIRGQRMLEVEDVLDQLSELCNHHEKVLVKPHPMAPQNTFMKALTRLFPNTEMVDDNFYHLISHEKLTHVYSLTSSTSLESSYFDKVGVHLCNYPYLFTDYSAIGGGYLSVKPGFYLPEFWQGILEFLEVDVNPYKPIHIGESRSRLRKSLRSYWGADIFEIL